MMMLRKTLAAAALLAAAFVGPAFAQDTYDTMEGRSDITLVPGEDDEMNAAIAQARATLPSFWDALRVRRGESYSLKVGMATRSGGVEHIWVRDMNRLGAGKVRAILDNEPADIAGVALNEPVTFDEDEISDWVVVCNGRTYGDYTTRVIFKHMTAADRAPYAGIIATLADGPPCAAPGV